MSRKILVANHGAEQQPAVADQILAARGDCTAR
jgi:hypothetical protein